MCECVCEDVCERVCVCVCVVPHTGGTEQEAVTLVVDDDESGAVGVWEHPPHSHAEREPADHLPALQQIGRASGRERV